MSRRPRLFYGNFDFERELVAGPGESRPATLERIRAELSCVWLAVAEEEDTIWSPGEWDAEFLAELQAKAPWKLPRVVSSIDELAGDFELVPWGWSPGVLRWAQDGKLTEKVVHPPLDVVKQVNSREFSSGLDLELKCGLAGSRLLTSISELEDALCEITSNSPAARWVLKANWSNSARERIVRSGRALTDADRRWAEVRWRRDRVLALEPWVEIVDEVGVQWDIPEKGAPLLVGIVPLLTADGGEYRGSEFGLDAARQAQIQQTWAGVVETQRRAVERIQAAGYFGPVGIDACRYRTAVGAETFRPLQDINARWTMGRLSLGWRRLLKSGERGRWRFGKHDDSHFSPESMISTSPRVIDDRMVRLSTWLDLNGCAPAAH